MMGVTTCSSIGKELAVEEVQQGDTVSYDTDIAISSSGDGGTAV